MLFFLHVTDFILDSLKELNEREIEELANHMDFPFFLRTKLIKFHRSLSSQQEPAYGTKILFFFTRCSPREIEFTF